MTNRHIEVFKTNIAAETEAKQLARLLLLSYPDYKVNFDLDDCDHILRIESKERFIDHQGINDICLDAGYYIEVLED